MAKFPCVLDLYSSRSKDYMKMEAAGVAGNWGARASREEKREGEQ